MLLYKIRLPKDTDAKAFVSFMREEYIPNVRKEPTRVGGVVSLVLLQGENGTSMHELFLQVEWGGLSRTDVAVVLNVSKDVQRKFESFGANFEFVGTYREVAAWHE